jgi:hypothetical protein
MEKLLWGFHIFLICISLGSNSSLLSKHSVWAIIQGMYLPVYFPLVQFYSEHLFWYVNADLYQGVYSFWCKNPKAEEFYINIITLVREKKRKTK